MYRIIVDSTFGLEKDFVEKNKIKVASLKLNLDNQIFDGANLDEWDMLYEKMLQVKEFPKTSQPSPEDFEQAIRQILAEDNNAKILILTMSHRLSGTYNCANLCAGLFPQNEIVVIDTLMTTILDNIVMHKVVELNNQGKSAAEIKNYVTKFREAADVLIMPHDLIYLHRGGRLSGLGYAVATAVNIKPLITLTNGELKNVKKVIGVKAALMEFVKIAKKPRSKVYLVEVYKSPYTEELTKLLKNNGIKVEKHFKMDPVIGCHVGPGGIAMGVIEDF